MIVSELGAKFSSLLDQRPYVPLLNLQLRNELGNSM